MLNDEQLWAKCGSGQRITFEDIGLDPSKHRNGTQILREGFEPVDPDILKKIDITLLILFILAILIAILIS